MSNYWTLNYQEIIQLCVEQITDDYKLQEKIFNLATLTGGPDEIASWERNADVGPDILEKIEDGSMPFHWAAMNPNIEVVKYFVDRGTDAKAKDKGDGTSTSDMAAKRRSISIPCLRKFCRKPMA